MKLIGPPLDAAAPPPHPAGFGRGAPAPQTAAEAPTEARGAASFPPPEAPEESDPTGLTEEQRVQRDAMAARDREVRAHENAHVTAGGPYVGRPSYGYEVGPDGRRYAVSGEVAIDTAPIEGDPDATILKMRVVERAALAPAEPSATDRAVAALARSQALQAESQSAATRRAEAGAPEEGVSVRL
jgi:hypothetical protein